jgi:signal recognition particle subunit SRP54
MFEALQESLSTAIRSLRGRGKLTESNMREGLRLVERSLLEADVHFEVVRPSWTASRPMRWGNGF